MHRIARGSWPLLTATVIVATTVAGCSLWGPKYPDEPVTGNEFPIGHVDSPFMLPDESAIYFLHSPVSTRGLLTLVPPWTKPSSQPLPGHHGTRTFNWYNTDLYVSERNPDGTYGEPVNLGSQINTDHFECCPWVNDAQTILIFTREGIGRSSQTGNYIARRPTKDSPWGAAELLEGTVGGYKNTIGLHDLHPTPSGDVYAWTLQEKDGPRLYAAPGDGRSSWRWLEPKPLGPPVDENRIESQPWVNVAETVLYYNRSYDNGDLELWRSERSSRKDRWGAPVAMQLKGFQDPAGHAIWGEPSFGLDGTLYFVRFDTSRKGWPAKLLLAPRNRDHSYGPPKPLRFRFPALVAPSGD